MSIVRRAYQRKWMWILTGTVAGAGLTGALAYRHHRASVAESPAPVGAYCETGIGAARRHARNGAGRSHFFHPAIRPNGLDSRKSTTASRLNQHPDGMTWIPGGQFWMGTTEDGMTDARPWHRVYVDGYWMDKTEVTNEQFARFVKATGYVTVAERKPRAEDYPKAPPEKLVAGSVVFSPPDHAVALNNHFQWWSYVTRRELAPSGGARRRISGSG